MFTAIIIQELPDVTRKTLITTTMGIQTTTPMGIQTTTTTSTQGL